MEFEAFGRGMTISEFHLSLRLRWTRWDGDSRQDGRSGEKLKQLSNERGDEQSVKLSDTRLLPAIMS